MITVVGMGRRVGDLTADGAEAIKNADTVVVKSQFTAAAEAVKKIRNDAVYCDDLYTESEDFDILNKRIVERLQSFGNGKIAFCVAGNGKDDTTAALLGNVQTVVGVGLFEEVLPSGAGGARVYTAEEFISERYVLAVPTVVTCIDDKLVAAEVQLKLLSAFDPDSTVAFTCGKTVKEITLDRLCKQRFDYKTAICVSPKNLTERQVFGFHDAVEVLRILRAPFGCPWDREQTHKSIIKNVIEEAYELADALEKEDVEHTMEELGDLLLQVLFHLEIAQDNGEFQPDAVYSALCRKLIDRHPHVFGEVKAESAEQSLDVWNERKQKEHKITSLTENVQDVPHSMASLMRCQKVQSRASKGGYDFQNVKQVVEKVKEELNEFLTADASQKEMEGGDLLFAVVNLLRLSKVDSETALMCSTEKFVNRVTECERILAARGESLPKLSAEQFDQVWSEAKGNVG